MFTFDKLQERRGFIGASEAAPILNQSPFDRSIDIAMQKLYGTIPYTTKPMEMGTALEPFIMSQAEQYHGPLLQQAHGSFEKWPTLRATPDGIIKKSPEEGVEAKTHGILSGRRMKDWGDALTDNVPAYVRIQVEAQMLAHHLERVHVWTLFCSPRLKIERYIIDADKELQEMILEGCKRFWVDYILKGVLPPGVSRIQTLQALIRREQATQEIESDFVTRYNEACEVEKAAKAQKDQAKAEMLQSLGDAEIGTIEGREVLKYLTQKKKGHVVKPSEGRVLRITSAGKALAKEERITEDNE